MSIPRAFEPYYFKIILTGDTVPLSNWEFSRNEFLFDIFVITQKFVISWKKTT